MGDPGHHPAERGKLRGLDQRFLGFPQMPQRGFGRIPRKTHFLLGSLAFGDFFGSDVDSYNLAAGRAKRVPVGDPEAFFGLIGTLALYLDPDDGLTRQNNGLHDLLDGIGEGRDAIPDEAPEMILDRDAAYFGQMLIDPQITAIRREARETDGGRIIDELKRRLMREQQNVRIVP
jgi:hypothetical protein